MCPKVDMSFMDEHQIVLKCGFAWAPQSQVPTHANNSQHGGEVPTFEP